MSQSETLTGLSGFQDGLSPPSASPPHQLQQRRLSSPPSLEKAAGKRGPCSRCGSFGYDCRCYGGSNNSSGSNSMQHLALSTLNTSR